MPPFHPGLYSVQTDSIYDNFILEYDLCSLVRVDMCRLDSVIYIVCRLDIVDRCQFDPFICSV